MVTLELRAKTGKREESHEATNRYAVEIDYYRHGGILPFVLRELMTRNIFIGVSVKRLAMEASDTDAYNYSSSRVGGIPQCASLRQ